MRKPLVRIILFLVGAELAYLVLANLALNLPLTQSLINGHRPEKYAVYWDRAWSWYPFRVHARGVSINGQTLSLQWQADLSAASASLSVLPLSRRTVQVRGVDAQDIGFRLRPRPKPGKDYETIRSFFPPIRDRDAASPAEVRERPRRGGGWRIVVDEIRAGGSHEFWVFQVRGALDGLLRANLAYETRGGPFSLSGGEADIELRSLILNKDWEVSSGGTVEGRFAFAPFVPSENRGAKVLGFLSFEGDLGASVDSLEFLNFYLRDFNGMQVDGRGQVSGHLAYERGDLVSGTDLAVSAAELGLTALPYQVKGDGGIGISVEPDDPTTLRMGIRFGALEALHLEDGAPLFSGDGLEITATGTTRILADEARESGQGRLSLRIPSVRVQDLRVYQRYLPDRWGVDIKGGQGSLHGQADYSSADINAALSLESDDADLLIKGYRFRTNLDLGLKISGGVSESATVDVSGTHLRLYEARLASAAGKSAKPWRAELSIERGRIGVEVPEGAAEGAGFRRLSETLKERGLKSLLSTSDARLEATLDVSDLGWINLLFRNPFELTVSGSGIVNADLQVRQGWLAEGTRLRARPRGLRVQVLDYEAQGRGEVVMTVERGGEAPDMRLKTRLEDAWLRRRGEKDTFVEQVSLEVSALARGVALKGGGSVGALDLRIPSARVRDMSVYNGYLPKDSPLRLLAGEADLTADVHLEPDSAGGFVKLETTGFRSLLDEQEVSGELALHVNLRDGVPRDMAFDISGSSLMLEGFRVRGEQTSYDRPGWRARFDLRKGQVVWVKPPRLDVRADVEMNDSRPIVALFANQRGKHGWLEKMLTVQDIRGSASLEVGSGRALVPRALVGSDKIDVGAKGFIDSATREGMFYARFRKLHGILKVKDGERNFDVLGARRKFNEYVPGETPLGLRRAEQPESIDASTDPEPEAPSNLFLE